MIQYSLKCDKDHSFDSWFQSAAAFEKLHSAGMVTCAMCGSSNIKKSIMAPRVTTSRGKAAPKTDEPTPAPTPSLSEPSSPAEKAIADMRKQVEKNSTYVGNDFAAEARAMHEGEAPERQIHGEANTTEAKKLVEDGIPVVPLPFMTNRKTN
ncbi:MAG: DUF1178 family protein [Paracoccaceae bacterium]|nr:DUF1178 family protein [Paracoccaceae bacterium]MDG1736714.1 DUF1178 family protein [Paracoccaceae bacterium]MDG2257545.1 DUF1178 family protein [Paracoccaceae bacterium]